MVVDDNGEDQMEVHADIAWAVKSQEKVKYQVCARWTRSDEWWTRRLGPRGQS